ncbi:MAG: flagellar biosynthesis anti-sigma factor FlgM [Firmicutes bacterium]|nr:flagellar biosynthesis anti-sigma factor FlgM [Bacillota bacterium]
MIISKQQILNLLQNPGARPGQAGAGRTGEVNKERGAGSRVGAPQGGRLDMDILEVSAQAREVDRLHEVLEHLPEVRAEKVESLKRAIAEGRYNVDPAEVAEKIMGRTLADRVTE